MESDKKISKTITINATTSKVWNYLINPELIKLWMADEEMEITSSWITGSKIIFRTTVNGKQEYKGNILRFELEKVFKYTSYSEIFKLPDVPENYSIIEFRLETLKNQTILSITHSNLLADTAIKHSNFYWNSALENIRKLCEKQSD
jgi:uncharacterized protein YndB with AHSA1/START domain